MVVPQSWASLVPKGDETAFKAAVYQIVLLVFLGLSVAALLAVYHLLTAFLKPILWAVLVGTVIFPVKRRCCSAIKSWLRSLQSSATPLALGLVKVPLEVFQQTSEVCWGLLGRRSTQLALVCYPLGQGALRLGALRRLCELSFRLIRLTDATVAHLSSYWVRNGVNRCSISVLILVSLRFCPCLAYILSFMQFGYGCRPTLMSDTDAQLHQSSSPGCYQLPSGLLASVW